MLESKAVEKFFPMNKNQNSGSDGPVCVVKVEEDGSGSVCAVKVENELCEESCDVGQTVDGSDFVESSVEGLVLVDGCEKLVTLGPLIEEEMEKVGLSDSDSESESSDSSSSSSLSSSTSGSDEDDMDDVDSDKEEGEIEEGEIMGSDSDVEELVGWSGGEDEDGDGGSILKGPIKSKNEIDILPPVPPVDVTLLPCHQTMPVGVVLSILGAQVIVEGMENHNPLSEGSVLWITDTRSPLGLIDEIFGPVKNPYYVVRYNSEIEVPTGIQEGTSISFVPDFADHVLSHSNLYRKGYDASGENDEEVSDLEFSDDEKEAEYKRMLKNTKRGTNNHGGNRINNRRKGKSRDKGEAENHRSPLASRSAIGMSQPASRPDHYQCRTPEIVATLNHSNNPCSLGMGQTLAGGMGLVPSSFPQVSQATGFGAMPGGPWLNGMASYVQQPGMVLANGSLAFGMMWPQQNNHPPQHPHQMPLPNAVPFQQQFFPQCGQPNFFTGPSCMPSPGMVAAQAQNAFNQMPLPSPGMVAAQAQNAFNQMPLPSPGMVTQAQNAFNQMPLGINPVTQNCPTPVNIDHGANMRPPATFQDDVQPPAQFNVGASSLRGRKQYHRGGGRSQGGRGREQFK